jgi:hypothetical protein
MKTKQHYPKFTLNIARSLILSLIPLFHKNKIKLAITMLDSLCGLEVKGSGSIPGATRFFWEVMGLERGPLSLMSTTEELLGRESSESCLEIQQYGSRDPSRWPRGSSIRKSWH